MISDPPTQGEPRQRVLVTALLALTNPTDDPFDLDAHAALVLLHGARLVPASALSMDIPDACGNLETVAASTAAAGSFAAHASGPSTVAYASGHAVTATDVADSAFPWPQQHFPAADAGFSALYAAPMRQGSTIHGVLVFYRSAVAPFTAADRTYGQALADTAAIALANHQAATRQNTLVKQLEQALASRLVIEQAKGFLAARVGMDSEAAFAVLRDYARSHQRKLRSVAQEVMETRTWPLPE